MEKNSTQCTYQVKLIFCEKCFLLYYCESGLVILKHLSKGSFACLDNKKNPRALYFGALLLK